MVTRTNATTTFIPDIVTTTTDSPSRRRLMTTNSTGLLHLKSIHIKFFVSVSPTSTPTATIHHWESRFAGHLAKSIIYFDEINETWIIEANETKLELSGLGSFFEPITLLKTVPFNGIVYNITITCHDVSHSMSLSLYFGVFSDKTSIKFSNCITINESNHNTNFSTFLFVF